MLENKQSPEDEVLEVASPGVIEAPPATPCNTPSETPVLVEAPVPGTTNGKSSTTLKRQPSDDTIYIQDNIEEIASDLEEIKQNLSDEVDNDVTGEVGPNTS